MIGNPLQTNIEWRRAERVWPCLRCSAPITLDCFEYHLLDCYEFEETNVWWTNDDLQHICYRNDGEAE